MGWDVFRFFIGFKPWREEGDKLMCFDVNSTAFLLFLFPFLELMLSDPSSYFYSLLIRSCHIYDFE